MIREIMKALELPKTSFQGTINNVSVFVSPGDYSVQITAKYEQIAITYNVPKCVDYLKEVKRLITQISKHRFESKYMEKGEEC